MSTGLDMLLVYFQWANSYKEYVEQMACAFAKETHLLPSECVMCIQNIGPDKDGIMTQRIWFESKTPR